MKISELAIVLNRMFAAKDKRLTEDALSAYFTVLREFPRMVVVSATAQAMRETKFLPSQAEIYKAARDISTRYILPEWAQMDEAADWLAYVKNYDSTSDFTDTDMLEIYRMIGDTKSANELTRMLAGAK